MRSIRRHELGTRTLQDPDAGTDRLDRMTHAAYIVEYTEGLVFVLDVEAVFDSASCDVLRPNWYRLAKVVQPQA